MPRENLKRAAKCVTRQRLRIAEKWLCQSKGRRSILLCLKQPMTARQLSLQTGMLRDFCSQLLAGLRDSGIVRCMNPRATRSRLYWLRSLGRSLQQRVLRSYGINPYHYEFPIVDWHLYGWVCYSHRAAVIDALSEPMQSATVKRRARAKDPTIRMSANNARDITKEFLAAGIVRTLKIRKKAHPRYELTEIGLQLRRLLREAKKAPCKAVQRHLISKRF